MDCPIPPVLIAWGLVPYSFVDFGEELASYLVFSQLVCVLDSYG